MSDTRSDEDLFRDLLTQAADRAPTVHSTALIGGARHKHRRHRLSQTAAAVVAVAIVGTGAGVLSTRAGGPAKFHVGPATIAPRPTVTDTAMPPPPVTVSAAPEVFALAGGGTDTAAGTSVTLIAASGVKTVTTVARTDVMAGSFTVGPSGKYVYWLDNAESVSHKVWRMPVGGGKPEVATSISYASATSYIVVNPDDSAVAYATGEGTFVTTFRGDLHEIAGTGTRPVGWTGDGAGVVVHPVGAGLFEIVDPPTGSTQFTYPRGAARCDGDAEPATVLPDGAVVAVTGGCSATAAASLVRIPHSGSNVTTTPLAGVHQVLRTYPLADGTLAMVSALPDGRCPVNPEVWLVSPTGTVTRPSAGTNCD